MVGNARIKFFVHRDLLCKRSTFFRKAIKDLDNEPKRIIDPPDQNPESFGIYVQSLYSGEVRMFEDFDEGVLEADRPLVDVWPPPKDEEWLRWRNCYILGEFLEDLDFQDASIDALMKRVYDRQDDAVFGLAHDIYSHSVAKSYHRRLAVHLYANCAEGRRHTFNPETHICDACRDFAVDVLLEIGNDVETRADCEIWRWAEEELGGCTYHEHLRLKKPCYKGTWKVHA